MSTRTNIRPQLVIPSPQGSPVNGSSMAGNITSAPTILQSLSKVGYQVDWDGTSPVGAISVQCSNDYSINAEGLVNNPGRWSTLTLSVGGSPVTSIPVTGNTGTGFIDIESLSAYAVRLVYTATSGTGTLIAYVNGKVS